MQKAACRRNNSHGKAGVGPEEGVKDGCILAVSFSVHSPINGILGADSRNLGLRAKRKEKNTDAFVAAATLAGAAVASSAPAEARWGWGLGGFAVGAVVGTALASSYYYPCRIPIRRPACGATYGTAMPGFAPASDRRSRKPSEGR